MPFDHLDLRAALNGLLREAAQENNSILFARAENLLGELDTAERSAAQQTHDLFISVVFKEHTP